MRIALLTLGVWLATSGASTAYDPQRLLAGHLLRRIAFGPTQSVVSKVLAAGIPAYVEQQLNPASVDDSGLESKIPHKTSDPYEYYDRIRRWYGRMVFSKRQLQEKMTLFWHEHFATSNDKVGIALLMGLQEDTLRANALGRFRDLLRVMTVDQAMLRWLDNDYNSGTALDDDGNPIPPNENYARELLQLFALGPNLLKLNGTPVLDATGKPVPAYSEKDVRHVARALTGWHVDYDEYAKAVFDPDLHDSGAKTILGKTLAGRSGADGANEVGDVVGILMQHPNVAPFIAKELIQKFAIETPPNGYVKRVAKVFLASNGSIKDMLRAVLLDPVFTGETVVRTQFKVPIEHFVGAVRALEGTTEGDALYHWTADTRHLLYYPPSVFSFYRPGEKKTFVNTALVTYTDRHADRFVAGWEDPPFDAETLIAKHRLDTPEKMVDRLTEMLLVAPLSPTVRNKILKYMTGHEEPTGEEAFRGAAWLLLCSPDFQRN